MVSPNLISNGAIGTSVFVSVDSSTSNACIQSASGAFPIGISQEGSYLAPVPGASSLATTASGQLLEIYGLGEVCLLNATSAGWTAGDHLKPATDGSGFGVTATTGALFGAIALETLSGVGLGRVQVVLGTV